MLPTRRRRAGAPGDRTARSSTRPTFRAALARAGLGWDPEAGHGGGQAHHSTHRWPWMLPDGKHVLYLAASHLNPARRTPGSTRFPSRAARQRGARLVRKRADGAGMAVVGQRGTPRGVAVRRRSAESRRASARANPADCQLRLRNLAGRVLGVADGILVYQAAQDRRGASSSGLILGPPRGQVGEPNNSFALRLSPDGTRASVIEGDPNSDLWIFELDRGFRTRLTTNEQVSRRRSGRRTEPRSSFVSRARPSSDNHERTASISFTIPGTARGSARPRGRPNGSSRPTVARRQIRRGRPGPIGAAGSGSFPWQNPTSPSGS